MPAIKNCNVDRFSLLWDVAGKLQYQTNKINQMQRKRHKSIMDHPRTCWCNRSIMPAGNPTVELRKNKDNSLEQVVRIKKGHWAPYVAGVLRCSSVWTCPTCSPHIMRGRITAIKKYLALIPGENVVMVSETVPHHAEDSLFETWNFLRFYLTRRKSRAATLKKFRSYRNIIDSFGINRGINSYDCTYSTRNGWHLHRHNILISNEGIKINALEHALKENAVEEMIMLKKLYPSRFKNSSNSDLYKRLIKVSQPRSAADYILKAGWKKYMSGYSVANEALGIRQGTSYKNIWFLPWPEKLFEFYQASKGKRLTTAWPKSFGAIINALMDEDEDEIANTETILREYDVETWRKIRRNLPEIMKSLSA